MEFDKLCLDPCIDENGISLFPPSLHGEETGPRKVCYKDKDTISTFIKPKSSMQGSIYIHVV